MAERIMFVCDICGKPAVETVKFSVNGRNLIKDFCSQHLADLVKNARAPKRGRRPGSTGKRSSSTKTTTKKRPGRPRKATRAARKPVGAKKRGRPRKRPAA
jgi:hypothetical protein